MKYVIYPVWAHRVRGEKDHLKILDPDIDVDLTRQGKVILFERLARSFSIGDGHELLPHVMEADRLQKEYDEDCEPVRVYVYETGPRLVPVYAGRQGMRGHTAAVLAYQQQSQHRPIQAAAPAGRYAGKGQQAGPANRAAAAAVGTLYSGLPGPAGKGQWQGTVTGRIASGTGNMSESNTPRSLS